ncbi:MAG: phage terminase large subunit (GpA) [Microvirga sp.]|jgi:phage terminase large subunit GpA-like protein|nr:phage terminase large subunit (GpA) [Microvirga sp.]
MTFQTSPEARKKLRAVVRHAFKTHFRPPPKLTLSEWADSYRKLSSEASAEPGQWYTERVPYLREPLDAVTDDSVETAVFMFAAQSAKTEILLNAIGYTVHLDPGPILIVEPRVEDCKALSKDRIAPMLRDTPALRGLVQDARTRDSGNTVLHKQFPGGHMTLAGGNSAAGLSMRPIRKVLLDEVSRYPASAGTEGDPVSLAIKRTTTFWNRKIIMASSPAIEGACRISAAYEETDQRKFWVPCPHCEEEQILDWSRVEWEKGEGTSRARHRPHTARYHCEHCGAGWTDAERWGALHKGRWVADFPERSTQGRVGFWVSQLYSPWKKLGELAQEYLDARGNAEREKAFQNTVLGLPYRQRGEAPEWQRLYDRREDWPANKLPKGVIFLTGFCDVQKDRLEVRVWGFGRDKQSWHIETRILMGDTSRPEVWAELDKLVGETWQHESGAYLKLARFGIDSGYATQEVYAWARRHPGGLVMVTKGDVRSTAVLGVARQETVTAMGRRAKIGVKVWPFNPDPLKRQFYGWLRLDKPIDGDEYPPGYVHLSRRAGDDEIKQLTAEQEITVTAKGGFAKREWQLLPGRRNEGLDCRVGAHACAIAFGLDRFSDRKWDELQESLDADAPKPEAKQPAPEPPPAPRGPVYRSTRRDDDRSWLAGDRDWLGKR